jgi:hypothetical protein
MGESVETPPTHIRGSTLREARIGSCSMVSAHGIGPDPWVPLRICPPHISRHTARVDTGDAVSFLSLIHEAPVPDPNRWRTRCAGRLGPWRRLARDRAGDLSALPNSMSVCAPRAESAGRAAMSDRCMRADRPRQAPDSAPSGNQHGKNMPARGPRGSARAPPLRSPSPTGRHTPRR